MATYLSLADRLSAIDRLVFERINMGWRSDFLDQAMPALSLYLPWLILFGVLFFIFLHRAGRRGLKATLVKLLVIMLAIGVTDLVTQAAKLAIGRDRPAIAVEDANIYVSGKYWTTVGSSKLWKRGIVAYTYSDYRLTLLGMGVGQFAPFLLPLGLVPGFSDSAFKEIRNTSKLVLGRELLPPNDPAVGVERMKRRDELLGLIEQSRRGDSFFSAHASNSMAFAVTAARLFPALSPFVYAVPLVVGYSRVYMGRHYPSDVLAGWLAGFLTGLLFNRLWAKLEPGLRKRLDGATPPPGA